MLKGILGILLFIFFLIVFVMMLIGGRILKALRDLRKAAEQAAEKQAQRQRYEKYYVKDSFHFSIFRFIDLSIFRIFEG